MIGGAEELFRACGVDLFDGMIPAPDFHDRRRSAAICENQNRVAAAGKLVNQLQRIIYCFALFQQCPHKRPEHEAILNRRRHAGITSNRNPSGRHRDGEPMLVEAIVPPEPERRRADVRGFAGDTGGEDGHIVSRIIKIVVASNQ